MGTREQQESAFARQGVEKCRRVNLDCQLTLSKLNFVLKMYVFIASMLIFRNIVHIPLNF
jgi:hypothetical protein